MAYVFSLTPRRYYSASVSRSRTSTDRYLLTIPRRFSQFCHVLLRFLVPRHPPNALTSLATKTVARQMGRSLRQLRLGCSSLPDGNSSHPHLASLTSTHLTSLTRRRWAYFKMTQSAPDSLPGRQLVGPRIQSSIFLANFYSQPSACAVARDVSEHAKRTYFHRNP